MKLSAELIEAYLDGSLAKAEAAKLELWLKGHPADAAMVQRQEALRQALAASAPGPSAAQSKKMWAAIRAQVQAEAAPVPILDLREPWYAFLFKPWTGALSAGLATAVIAIIALIWRPWAGVPMQAPETSRAEAPALAQADAAKAPEPQKEMASAPAAQPGAALASAAKPSSNVVAKKAAVASLGGASPAAAGAGAVSAERDDERSVAVAKSAAPAAPKASRLDTADRAAAPAAMAAAPAASAMAFMAAPQPKAEAPTEVERALADSGVDGMIDAYLAAQRSGAGARTLARRPSFSQDSLSSPLAGLSRSSAADEAESLDSQQLGAAQGGIDQNGFWNWRPAAIALNKRDWSQARLELEAARDKASESSERAFAGSALTLLGAPGAPLAGQTEALPGVGELRVLGAGRWQLMVDSRLARFSEGVSARLPGFRAQGDSLLLDLTFDRGSFAAGTRFTRLAGEKAATVLDAQGRPVVADEFSAPAGATYNVSGQKLNLR